MGSKATLEISEALLRRAQSAPVERGVAFRVFVSEALAEKLAARSAGERPWMQSFGALRALRHESARINRIIQAEFDPLEPEDRD